MLLTVNQCGLYCKAGRFYIDPWKPVDVAIISHGHSDHMRWGMKRYICHHDTVPVLKLRMGNDVQVTSYGYHEPFEINGVKISFHPAGHIIGSCQVRVEYQGEVWNFTGDFKILDDGVSPPYELVPCDFLITETTFGLPVYRFPDPRSVYDDINRFWRETASEGLNTVLLAYALGKAQNVLAHLDTSIGEIYLHGAVANINEALKEAEYSFPGRWLETPGEATPAAGLEPAAGKNRLTGAAIVAPPSVLGTPWLAKLRPYRIAMCSGWMQLRGARRRRGVDRGFPLSDHCDWGQLNWVIRHSGARQVFVTHGYESSFSRWVQEHYGIPCHIFQTLYSDAEEELI